MSSSISKRMLTRSFCRDFSKDGFRILEPLPIVAFLNFSAGFQNSAEKHTRKSKMIYFKAVSKLALLLITLLSLTGCDYPPPPTVTPVGCIPSPLGTQFADVTGDGKADAIAINVGTAGAPPAGITVRRSDGSKFLANESWTTGPFSGGTLGTYFADVNGDGKADEIEVNSEGEYVRLSTGSSFDPAVKWSDPVYDGIQGTYFADVNGDGKADIIAVKSDGVYVGLSTGSSFGPSVTWTNGAYYGSGNTQGAYFADVTGDGKADAIVDNFDPTTNTGGITVRRSDGTQFL